MKIEDLEKEIAQRSENRSEIRKSMDEYCKIYYGIDNFSSAVDMLFREQKKFGVCLARQISTVNVEHLAKKCFAEWLSSQGISTEAIALELTVDSFSGRSDIKKSYCNIPYYSIKGSHFRKIIAKKERGRLDKKTLAQIQTMDGKALPDYHRDLREKVFGDNRLEVDFSSFFLRCLQECIENNAKGKPDYLFVEKPNENREMRIRTEKSDGHKILRPSADWYYPLYLLSFMDGSRALLSTVEDDNKVSLWFEKANHQIEKIIGFSPLIIYTPKGVEMEGYKSNLLEIPEWIFQDVQWRDKIEMPSNDSTFFRIYEFFEKQFLKSRE